MPGIVCGISHVVFYLIILVPTVIYNYKEKRIPGNIIPGFPFEMQWKF